MKFNVFLEKRRLNAGGFVDLDQSIKFWLIFRVVISQSAQWLNGNRGRCVRKHHPEEVWTEFGKDTQIMSSITSASFHLFRKLRANITISVQTSVTSGPNLMSTTILHSKNTWRRRDTVIIAVCWVYNVQTYSEFSFQICLFFISDVWNSLQNHQKKRFSSVSVFCPILSVILPFHGLISLLPSLRSISMRSMLWFSLSLGAWRWRHG